MSPKTSVFMYRVQAEQFHLCWHMRWIKISGRYPDKGKALPTTHTHIIESSCIISCMLVGFSFITYPRFPEPGSNMSFWEVHKTKRFFPRNTGAQTHHEIVTVSQRATRGSPEQLPLSMQIYSPSLLLTSQDVPLAVHWPSPFPPSTSITLVCWHTGCKV